MENKVKTIKLTPRFIIDDRNMPAFAGYNQVDGDMILDDSGHIYELVKLSDYRKLEKILEFAEQFLDNSQYAMYLQGLGMEGLEK